MKHQKVVQNKIRQNYSDLPYCTRENYIPIDKRLFELGDRINFSLFYEDLFSQLSLFLQSESVIEPEHKEKLRNLERVYIHKTHKNNYESFMGDKLQYTVENDSLSLEEKVDIIYSSTSQLTNSILDNPEALENVERSKKIVEPILQTVFHNESTIKSFIKIIGYDYYTHTHSLNVSIYSLCLGSALGLDEEKLKKLGSAALLHDLGKSAIDHNIVNKPGALSREEFESMKKHPELGYDIAMKIGIKDRDILSGIRHHHEKLDGSGYPDGLSKKEIEIFPRIIGICDIFDALTTKRSYKMALSSYDAIFLMKTHMGKHLDLKMIDKFIRMLHG